MVDEMPSERTVALECSAGKRARLNLERIVDRLVGLRLGERLGHAITHFRGGLPRERHRHDAIGPVDM